MTPDSTPGYAAFDGAQVYNEAAFRRFLMADLARARRFHRSLLLVLITVCFQPGRPIALSNRASTAVFKGLTGSVREVDFVGWFRNGTVPAALLASGPLDIDAHATTTIAARIRSAVQPRLPESPDALRIRMVRLGTRRPHSLTA